MLDQQALLSGFRHSFRRRPVRRCDFRVITLNPKSMMQPDPGITLAE
jgi:hypothetical protein